jgi:phosphate transport system substrate-binding protein
MKSQNTAATTKWKAGKRWALGTGSTLALAAVLAGCGASNTQTADNPATPDAGAAPTEKLSGQIKIDGSSTVFPITEAVAEEFGKENPDVKVTVGMSGTGGGFKKFAANETAISNASRPIKGKEAAAAKAKNIDFVELPIAYDGLSVVVHPKNTWATCLTTEELKKIWDKGSKINNWSQVRKGFPNKPLKLYGPGTDSGTFDYFTDEINGEEGRSRADYTASEDDNTLVQGVSSDEGALGYFGFAYYEENADKLKLVQVNGGSGCVAPAADTIQDGKYAPLSRPLFIYVSTEHMDKPEVAAFVKYYLTNVKDLVKSVGYIPLPDSVYQAASARFENKKTGSVYADKDAKEKTVEELFAATP